MIDKIKTLLSDKKEYKELIAKSETLPNSYKLAFDKLSEYIWSFSDAYGSDMISVQRALLELLQEGTANGKSVLEVTGDDAASLCDELMRDAKKWTDKYKTGLNGQIQRL